MQADFEVNKRNVSFAIGSDYLQFLWRKRIAIGYSNHYSRFSGSTGELSHFVQGEVVGIGRRQHCHEVGWKVGFEGAGEGFVVAEVADDDVAARVRKAGARDEQVAQLRQVGPVLRRGGYVSVDVHLANPKCTF